ncbi:MAG: hypothetical protein QOG43_2177 [Actinomycetota bacterium]|nr:hypothetical protein [Actinomycetota bacterium]
MRSTSPGPVSRARSSRQKTRSLRISTCCWAWSTPAPPCPARPWRGGLRRTHRQVVRKHPAAQNGSPRLTTPQVGTLGGTRPTRRAGPESAICVVRREAGRVPERAPAVAAPPVTYRRLGVNTPPTRQTLPATAAAVESMRLDPESSARRFTIGLNSRGRANSDLLPEAVRDNVRRGDRLASIPLTGCQSPRAQTSPATSQWSLRRRRCAAPGRSRPTTTRPWRASRTRSGTPSGTHSLAGDGRW